MFEIERKRKWYSYPGAIGAVIMLIVACDIHAFAGESRADTGQPGVKTLPAAGRQAGEGVSDTTDMEKTNHLLTREEMLKGMIEAERLRAKAARPDVAIDNRDMLEKWGVQVISVSYAADGFWLNFRFRVVDPAKAAMLFDSKIKPYLEAESSGLKMTVPSAARVGALRTTDRGHNIKPNKIYNIMFSNPGFHVRLGQKVSVVVGDFRAEHMTVRGIRENLRVKTARAKPHEMRGMSGDMHAHHHQMMQRQGYTRSTRDYVAPDLSLVDMDGDATSLRDLLDTNEPVMMNFIFTTCTTICPVLSATFSQVQQELGAEARQVRMISVTIDPEQDTPQQLKQYAERYGAGSQWRFLTGELDNIVALEKAFDIYRGSKANHEPITLLRGSRASSWVRLDGIASASDIIGEYRALASAEQ